MAKTKLNPELQIEVGGELYHWRIHAQPKWSRDPASRHGMAIAVRHIEGQREAIVEFPLGPAPRFGMPLLRAQHIDVALVANAIASAMAAGWEPLSRGKTVNIMVDAAGG